MSSQKAGDRPGSAIVENGGSGPEDEHPGPRPPKFVVEMTRAMRATGLEMGAILFVEADGSSRVFNTGIDHELASSIWDKVADGISLRDWTKEQINIVTDDREKHDYLRNFPELPLSLALGYIDLGNGSYALALMGKNVVNFGLAQRRDMLYLFSNQLLAILQSENDKQELVRRNEELRTLYETSQAVASSLDRDEVLGIIAKRAAIMINAEVCLIMEARKKERLLQCLAVYSVKEHLDPRHLRLRFGEGLSGLVAETGEGLLIKRADLDDRSKLVDGTEDEPSSVISIPLKTNDELLGVMTLEKTPGIPFTEAEYHLMEMFSLQVVLAFKNSKLYSDMKGLLQSQQMYNILLTHDVANYNVPIHGYLEMLIKDPKLDERERRFVRSSLMQSENISSLISDVRKLWWLRSGAGDSEFQPVELVHIVREAIDSLGSHILFGNREISMVHKTSEAWVNADMFLKDVIYNILSNACKYGEKGPVLVKLYSEEVDSNRYWRVDVEDEGKGIPDARKVQLFKRFDQFDSDTASEGHGLGLSVVLAFVTHYGGQTWVENRVEGDWTKGSRFVVLLPMADKQS